MKRDYACKEYSTVFGVGRGEDRGEKRRSRVGRRASMNENPESRSAEQSWGTHLSFLSHLGLHFFLL